MLFEQQLAVYSHRQTAARETKPWMAEYSFSVLWSGNIFGNNNNKWNYIREDIKTRMLTTIPWKYIFPNLLFIGPCIILIVV